MSVQILTGDCRATLLTLPEKSVQCCVTSPPYFGLRNYNVEGQIGLEPTPDEYVREMVAVFSVVKRVLKDDGVLWLNLGDSYANDSKWGGSSGGKHVKELHGNTGVGRSKKTTGIPAKNLIGIPWMVAFALRADGWTLRAACPWIKRNGMPDSTQDRPTQCIETVFMLTKSKTCYYDAESVKVKAKYSGIAGMDGSGFKDPQTFSGKNADTPLVGPRKAVPGISSGKRLRRSSDWFFESWQGLLLDSEDEPMAFVVNTKGYKGAHFATFPTALIEPCVFSTSRPGDTILDPFGGSGTTAEVATKHGRKAILCELNPEYVNLANQRLYSSLLE